MEITIKGEKHGLLWGLNAIDKFATSLVLPLEEALKLVFTDDKASLTQTIALAKFVTCAIDSYAKVNRTVADVTYEDVLAEFDGQGMELVTAILQDFLESKIVGVNISDYLAMGAAPAEEGNKKKVKNSPSEKS